MNIEFGIKVNAHNKTLNLLRPVIHGWRDAIVEYCIAAEGDDVPYYYNERANISLFAAGAWKSGEIALEEYASTKKSAKRKTGHHHGPGRCDLYITLDRKHDVKIEAKQGWMPENLREKTHRERIKSKLKTACDDADRGVDTSARIGCVFFTVSFPATRFPKYRSDPDFHIHKEILRFADDDEADLWAWCFPKLSRSFREMDAEGHYRYWPGIVVGMKVGKFFRGI